MGINNSFGNYSPPEEQDDGIQEFFIGLFFDGTLNNEKNVYARKEHEKKKKGLAYDKDAADEFPMISMNIGSYENDFSNVARMYRFYDNGSQQSIYIEGIGTDDKGGHDNVRGFTTGTGVTGVEEKVKAGCKKAVDKMSGKKAMLTIDVFGFSRGAAAARHFVSEATKAKYKTFFGKQKPARGALGEELEKAGIELVSFKIRFVGLYDTVSSHGVNFGDDVEDLGLDAIRSTSVKHVVQLAAHHEWRKNFSLTDITSAEIKGKQFTLPGAHSDIGGGYEDGDYEQDHSITISPARVINDKNEYKNLADEKRQPLIDEGWYLEKQLSVGARSNKYVNHVRLNGKRFIDKRYSYIPLQLMCKLADEKESQFKVTELERPKNFQIPSITDSGKPNILVNVKAGLQKYIDENKDSSVNLVSYKNYLDETSEKALINGYVHWSATGNIGSAARKNNQREIISG